MKFTTAATILASLPAISARFIEKHESLTDTLVMEPSTETFLIELAPGLTREVTEEQKWELRRAGTRFIDITDHRDEFRIAAAPSRAFFPKKPEQQSRVNPMFKDLNKQNMKDHLTKFTSFHTRYYKSEHGKKSSEWLLEQVKSTVEGSKAANVTVEAFSHKWQQSSIIARIPGKSEKTVVIGAHQDSINLWFPSVLPAPGADDDGSGTVTILEVFRTLLKNKDVAAGHADNTIEFHWYSAEEGGLLGSQDVFSSYAKEGRVVKAMLQQDMTGYSKKTHDEGKVESVGVITDFVNPELTTFIKQVITEYCNIPYIETECGYACSDHASASKAGYPSAFVIESAFSESSPYIHTADDTVEHIDFDHMLEHARMTLGLVVELGFSDFDKLEAEASMGEL